MTTKTLRISYATKKEDLSDLIGATISQMYSEYKGRMGYTVTPVDLIVEAVDVVQGGVAIQFAGQSQATLVKQAMIVYAKDEKADNGEDQDADEDSTEGESAED